MGETTTHFDLLRQAVGGETARLLEDAIETGADHELGRINPLAFAGQRGAPEEAVIAAFLHAAQLGLFEMSWNVLCPGCGGVLDAGATLKSVDRSTYSCSLCAAGYEPTLDEMVEVTFTVSPRIRRIAAHNPDSLPYVEYCRQVFWGSGVDLPADFEAIFDEITLESIELPAGEKAVFSLQAPEKFLIVFDPVTHATQFIDVAGEPTRERQSITFVIDELHAANQTVALRPGPFRLAVENRTARRVLPGIWIADDKLHDLVGRRRPFLTAKRLLSNQTFRDTFRTDTLGLDQRLKITSITFLFTDLKGSTELYERVGDLAAFELVRAHFRVLNEIVAAEAGAVVKTIGDAVMATFPTPDRAVTAALRMRQAMQRFNAEHGRGDLVLKIGIHEGPCLAVTLNDRQDFFGQTVNIASRVQGLAVSEAIFATQPVVEDPRATSILADYGVCPQRRQRALRGFEDEFTLYELP
jgi:class 3 adenylate cyclase